MRPPEKNSGEPVTIIGIDPGSLSCGYGVISLNGAGCGYVSSGRIVLEAKSPLHVRLKDIYEGLCGVIKEFGPSEAAVEKIFFAKGAKSALSLGHARGAALLALAQAGLCVYEYSALEVKKAVTGYGRAEKRQVQEMVRRILKIDTALSPDGADALAIAICRTSRARLEAAIGREGIK